jgi:hypothetical protein
MRAPARSKKMAEPRDAGKIKHLATRTAGF